MSLWVDEAVIANIVSRGRYDGYLRYPASNRPFGFLAVTGWLARAYNAELSLRLLSIVPSLLSLPLIIAISAQLFRSRVFVLLAVFSTAFNAWLVTFAKDFKPYAAEHFLVLFWVWLFLRWSEAGQQSVLACLVVAIAIAPAFTHAPIFVVPMLTIAVISTKHGSRWSSIAIAVGALIATALAWMQYRLIGSRTPAHLFESASVNYLTGDVNLGVTVWFWERFVSMVGDFGTIARDPAEFGTWKGAAFLAILIAGWFLAVVRFLFNKEWSLLCLFIGPIVIPMVLSVVFPWPFGPERVNLYAASLLTLTILLGWDWALANVGVQTARVVFALGVVALQMPVDLSTYGQKYGRFGSAQEELVPAVNRIIEIENARAMQGSPGCLVFNRMSSYAVRYYSTFHATMSPKLRTFLSLHPHEFAPARRGVEMRAAVRRAMDNCSMVWVVLSHYNDEELSAAREMANASWVVYAHEEQFVGVTIIALVGDSDRG